ncbi:hypothetical protein EXE42_01735 [Halorubrum sp. SP3]|uniref:DUF7332 family protein n=1 Tax=unclassified Halorubrum TaxID=2642239 RepID=UPI0010F80326|nr:MULTISPECIES: hypothetical protein [unclassified Halorubrum]TKX55743.1 hypothetical protein EXE42_01735 [Halorubrum sp. SP3]TKX71473.1 hypothetical protein EXE45_00955 [Halorubrum sp. SP9]
MDRPGSRAVALSLLVVVATAGVGAAAGQTAGVESLAQPSAADSSGGPATVGPGVDANEGITPITRCFSGEGYPISIGGGKGGATMAAVIHLSVLTDPAAGNEFGLETAGRLGDESIVTLAAGVRLTAREAFANGVDPFAAFDVLYTYELRLPMFEGAVGDAEYEDDGSPIGSSAGAVAC